MRSRSSVAALPRRDRIVVAGCIAGATVLAWAYLVHLGRQMSIMAAMGMVVDAPWQATDVIMTWIMWSVMMIGMMSPSAAPILLLFAETQAQRGGRRVPASVLMFGLGYLAVWLGFSAVAALAQAALHAAALLSPAMAATSPRLGGAILIAAGVYQLTPAKGACLRHCQTPLGFLMAQWRDGAMGALQMGLRHGVYCLGCCWAVMCVLFVVGVMNLAWVGVLTVFILLERIGRGGMIAARVGGFVMVAAGAFVLRG